MKGRYLKSLGGLALAALTLVGTAFISADSVQAQNRQVHGQRRVVIVRRFPRFHRRWWGSPFGYNRWGYNPWTPYGNYYSHYVFDDSESAMNQGYKDGFKTGKSDGKKDKTYKPERSHYFKEAGFGNFGEAYRSSFERGYQEGFRVGQNERAS
jgi:hypothetical protein